MSKDHIIPEFLLKNWRTETKGRGTGRGKLQVTLFGYGGGWWRGGTDDSMFAPEDGYALHIPVTPFELGILRLVIFEGASGHKVQWSSEEDLIELGKHKEVTMEMVLAWSKAGARRYCTEARPDWGVDEQDVQIEDAAVAYPARWRDARWHADRKEYTCGKYDRWKHLTFLLNPELRTAEKELGNRIEHGLAPIVRKLTTLGSSHEEHVRLLQAAVQRLTALEQTRLKQAVLVACARSPAFKRDVLPHLGRRVRYSAAGTNRTDRRGRFTPAMHAFMRKFRKTEDRAVRNCFLILVCHHVWAQTYNISILQAPEACKFITCDRAGWPVRVGDRKAPKGEVRVGLNDPDACSLYPLSPDVCLRLVHAPEPVPAGYKQLTKQEVQAVNTALLLRADSWTVAAEQTLEGLNSLFEPWLIKTPPEGLEKLPEGVQKPDTSGGSTGIDRRARTR